MTLMGMCWRIEWPTASMRLIALKLADCANDEGENIYPSVGRVERETGLAGSTVRRDIAAMEECGLLEVIEEASGNKWDRSTTIRRFDVEKLKSLTWTERRRGRALEIVKSAYFIAQVDSGKTNGRGKPTRSWTMLQRSEPLHVVEGRQAAASPGGGGVAAPGAPPRGGDAANDRPSTTVGAAPPPRSSAPPRGGPKPLKIHKRDPSGAKARASAEGRRAPSLPFRPVTVADTEVGRALLRLAASREVNST